MTNLIYTVSGNGRLGFALYPLEIQLGQQTKTPVATV